MSRCHGSYLVHSFPRRTPCDFGIATHVLEAILRYGLLLTPEVVVVEPEDPRTDADSALSLYQCRVSFTHVTGHDLHEHERRFGCISLLFDEQAMHRYGAMPVFYLPRPTANPADSNLLSRLGIHFLSRLAEIRDLLNTLNAFEARGTHRHLVDSLPSDRAEFSQLAATVDALSSLFYATTRTPGPAVDTSSYFLQREWRVIGQIMDSVNGIEVSHLAEEEKRFIEQADPEFFGATVIRGTDRREFLDESLLLRGKNGEPVHRAIVAIRAPRCLTRTVRRMLSRHGIQHIDVISGGFRCCTKRLRACLR